MDTDQKRLELIQALTGKTVWQGYVVKGARTPLVPVLRECTILSVADVCVAGSYYEATASVKVIQKGKEDATEFYGLVYTETGDIYLDGDKCYQLEVSAKQALVRIISDKIREICRKSMYLLMDLDPEEGGEE